MIPRLQADLRLNDLWALRPSGNKYQDIRDFESEFAALAGQKHAVFFPYGRTAQLAILRALNLQESGRTEVICPSYTCVVVAHAILAAGLTPVFVDAGEDYNMRLDLLQAATTQRTGAVLATSVFGHPVDGKALAEYTRHNPDVFILQDCAHSFFAESSTDNPVHKQGLCAFYGMNISKIMTSIFGGMVTSDHDEFVDRLRAVRSQMLTPSGWSKEVKQSVYLMAVLVAFQKIIYGFVNGLERSGLLNRFTRYYDENNVDLPQDACDWPTGLSARVGRIQCKRYHDIVAHRRMLANLYHDHLQDVPGLLLPPRHDGATISHFVIRTDQAKEVEQYCLKEGVQLGRLIDYDVAFMPPFRECVYHGEEHSRSYPEKVVNLPVHTGVRPADAEKIVAMVKSAMERQHVIPAQE